MRVATMEERELINGVLGCWAVRDYGDRVLPCPDRRAEGSMYCVDGGHREMFDGDEEEAAS